MDQLGDFIGGGARTFSQFPDFIGDDGKAEAVFPGAGRFNRGVAANFAALPESLQRQIRLAIQIGNLQDLKALTLVIQPLDPGLAAIILEAVDSFDLGPLQDILTHEA